MVLRVIVITIVYVAALIAVLFGTAGTFQAPAFWAYIAEMLVLGMLAFALVNKRSPDLVAERMHPGAGEQDKITLRAGVALGFVHYAVAGLDVGRYHWSSSVPVALQVAAFVAIAVGYGMITWAMLENRFFSSAVRLQPDRGQRVIDTGPYAIVRHPGYTGGILYLMASGVALGSWLSVVPMLIVSVLIIRRTLLEDRMLQESLDGYSGYARRVRYRLVPGLW